MKGSLLKIVLLCVVLVVLVSVSGSLIARAQESAGGGEETISQPDAPLNAKSPDQSVQTAGSPIGGPGEEVNRPTTDLPDKASSPNLVVDGAPAFGTTDPGSDYVDPNAPNAIIKYFTSAGAVYIPYTNALSWSYGGSGCLAPTTTGFWRSGVYIPDASIMKSFWFGYYNTASSTASTGYLYRYSYLGEAFIVAQINSQPGTVHTGFHYVSITIPNLAVDNFDNAYAFAWSGSGNQQLCYMQVGYTPYNAFGVAMPTVLKNP